MMGNGFGLGPGSSEAGIPSKIASKGFIGLGGGVK